MAKKTTIAPITITRAVKTVKLRMSKLNSLEVLDSRGLSVLKEQLQSIHAIQMPHSILLSLALWYLVD